MMTLTTPIPDVGRAFKMYAKRLEKLGLYTMGDFLYHIPFRYENYSLISKINQIQPGEIITIQGTVEEMKNAHTKNNKIFQQAKVTDDTGTLDVTWFNQPYLTKTIHAGDHLSLSGKADWFARTITLQSPDFETMYPDYRGGYQPTIHTGRLVPIYPETYGVSSKWLRRQIFKILQEHKDEIIEFLPDSILEHNKLYQLIEALQQIHFPDSLESTQKARLRLAFDELFLLQLAALKRKREWKETLVSHPFEVTTHREHIEKFFDTLPFTLTNAQQKAVEDIFSDMHSDRPMNRLLEGDVGSGKTVVSAIAMYLAYLNGYQSTLMAPTEILANQHYQTISTLLEPMGLKVELVTGSIKLKKGKGSRVQGIGKTTSSRLNPDILIGTHALLSENITFDKLGLVVIDEQQRFGVEQRAVIRGKGESPHLLTMTATPIPRTIALTLYGDLDLSFLDELPKGRKLIKTWYVPSEKRGGAYEWIEKQIKEHDSQAFIICPFIEESETMQTIKAATKEFEHLQKNVFKNLKLGLLHGKQKGKEKDEVLQRFKNKEFQILVATPVVEVGIDIPNTTIIMIEAAERFGLSQLHQLRGRVGRGEKQSYCLLFTESQSDHAIKRLRAMETLHVGSALAELDLQMRGPGELYGTMQHGSRDLKVASFSDRPLIELARREAEKIFPKLSDEQNLLQKINSIAIKQVSPD